MHVFLARTEMVTTNASTARLDSSRTLLIQKKAVRNVRLDTMPRILVQSTRCCVKEMMDVLDVLVANMENWNRLLMKQMDVKNVPLVDFLIRKEYQQHTLRIASFARHVHRVDGAISKQVQKNQSVKIVMQVDTRPRLQQVQKVTVLIAKRVHSWKLLVLTKKPIAKNVQQDLHKNRLVLRTVCRARLESIKTLKEKKNVHCAKLDVQRVLQVTIKQSALRVVLEDINPTLSKQVVFHAHRENINTLKENKRV